ncbi:MAG: ABC transporter permease subunit [Tissierellia bacterium]|nr:ABC transporter permease subunit [Tissierellia bacterium]
MIEFVKEETESWSIGGRYELPFDLLKILRERRWLILLVLSVLIGGAFVGYQRINHYQHSQELYEKFGPWAEILGPMEANGDNSADNPLQTYGTAIYEVLDTASPERAGDTPAAVLSLYEIVHQLEGTPWEDHLLYQEKFDLPYEAFHRELVKKAYPYVNETTTLYGANLVKRTLDQMFSLPLFLLLLIVCIGIYTAEWESGTWKFRMMNPGSRFAKHLAKVLSGTILSTFFILLILQLVYFTGGLLEGFGHWDYPVLIGPKSVSAADIHQYTYRLTTVGRWSVQSLMLYIVFLFASFSIVQMISIFIKESIGTILFSMLLIGSVVIGFQRYVAQPMEPVVPFWMPLAGASPVVLIEELRRTIFPFFVVPIFFGLLITALSALMEGSAIVRRFLLTRVTEPIERTFVRWERGKNNLFPELQLEWKKLCARKGIKVGLLIGLLILAYAGYHEMSMYDRALETRREDALELYEELQGPEGNTFSQGFRRRVTDWIKRMNPNCQRTIREL